MNRRLFLILIFLSVLISSVSGVEFSSINFYTEEDVLMVRVSLEDLFTKDAFDSLKNGQEIKFLLEVTFSEKRSLFGNKKIKSSEEKNIIQFNLVTETYHVVIGKKIEGRKEYLDESLEKAVSDIKKFNPVSVLEKKDVNKKSGYSINIKCQVVSLKMSPPISFIFDFFFDLNYSISKTYYYKGDEILEKYFN